jgi:two-component system, OmpR family, sensor kinase
MVSADRTAIEQTIVAITTNAVKHTHSDAIISLRVYEQQYVAIVDIVDDGPGLAPADVERIFERFYRTDASRARYGNGGSGLGLSIAKAIVDAHDGTISVTSAPGKGCRFEIRLPVHHEPGV